MYVINSVSSRHSPQRRVYPKWGTRPALLKIPPEYPINDPPKLINDLQNIFEGRSHDDGEDKVQGETSPGAGGAFAEDELDPFPEKGQKPQHQKEYDRHNGDDGQGTGKTIK